MIASIAISTLCLSATTADELAIVRVRVAGGLQVLDIHRAPGTNNNSLGPVLASDETFFPGKGPDATRFVFAADADGDGLDEICVVRQKKVDGIKDLRLKAYDPPTKFDGSSGAAKFSTKKGSLGVVKAAGSALNVAALGAGDADDDGADDLFVVRDVGDGTQELLIRPLPTAKNVALPEATAGVSAFTPGADQRVVSLCGLDYDGDGDDEIAALVRGLTGSTFTVYAMPTALDATPTVLARSAILPAPLGFEPVAICRIRDGGDIADEIGLLLTHGNGAARFAIYEPPVGLGQFLAPSLFEDNAVDVPSGEERALAPLSLRGFAFATPAAAIGGTWSATFEHTIDGATEKVELVQNIVAQQAGSVVSLSLPLFHFAQALYSPGSHSLAFTTTPVEFNGPGSGQLYSLDLAAGLVFAGDSATYVIGAYTGTKKLPLGQTAQLTGGWYSIEIGAP